jgi:hypothetical protein
MANVIIDGIEYAPVVVTQDDIARMAQEAGLVITDEAVWKMCELVAAAWKLCELVAATEREACAKIAETVSYRHDIADAIRARNDQ